MSIIPGEKSEEAKPRESSDLIPLIERYTNMRDTRLTVERNLKELKQMEDDLEEEIWNLMEKLGFTSVKTEENGLIVRTFNRVYNITDLRIFRAWCIAQSQYDLMREEAHKSNLKNYCNEKMKEGGEDSMPPGVEMIVDKIIQIRGRRKEDNDD